MEVDNLELEIFSRFNLHLCWSPQSVLKNYVCRAEAFRAPLMPPFLFIHCLLLFLLLLLLRFIIFLLPLLELLSLKMIYY